MFFPGPFSPQPWSSPPHPALILISITSHHGNCRMSAHTRANLCTCWQLLAVVGEHSAVLALCQRWEGCPAMSPLVCCAAHLRGGLTPPAGHPLGASSWGRLLIFFIISMQVGRGSLSLPSSARGQRRAHYRAALKICRVLTRLWYPSVPESSTAPRANVAVSIPAYVHAHMLACRTRNARTIR